MENIRPRPQGSSPIYEYSTDEEYFNQQDIMEVNMKTEVEEGAAGFSISGGGEEGIFVKHLLKESAASNVLSLREGDQLLSATIYFDNMKYEDALKILQYSKPYRVEFNLKRKLGKEEAGEMASLVQSNKEKETQEMEYTKQNYEAKLETTEKLRDKDDLTVRKREHKTNKSKKERLSWPKFQSIKHTKLLRHRRSHSTSETYETSKPESFLSMGTESHFQSEENYAKGKEECLTQQEFCNTGLQIDKTDIGEQRLEIKHAALSATDPLTLEEKSYNWDMHISRGQSNGSETQTPQQVSVKHTIDANLEKHIKENYNVQNELNNESTTYSVDSKTDSDIDIKMRREHYSASISEIPFSELQMHTTIKTFPTQLKMHDMDVKHLSQHFEHPKSTEQKDIIVHDSGNVTEITETVLPATTDANIHIPEVESHATTVYADIATGTGDGIVSETSARKKSRIRMPLLELAIPTSIFNIKQAKVDEQMSITKTEALIKGENSKVETPDATDSNHSHNENAVEAELQINMEIVASPSKRFHETKVQAEKGRVDAEITKAEVSFHKEGAAVGGINSKTGSSRVEEIITVLEKESDVTVQSVDNPNEKETKDQDYGWKFRIPIFQRSKSGIATPREKETGSEAGTCQSESRQATLDIMEDMKSSTIQTEDQREGGKGRTHGIKKETSVWKIHMPIIKMPKLPKRQMKASKSVVGIHPLDISPPKVQADTKDSNRLNNELKMELSENEAEKYESLFKMPTFRFPTFAMSPRKGSGSQVNVEADQEEKRESASFHKGHDEITFPDLEEQKSDVTVAARMKKNDEKDTTCQTSLEDLNVENVKLEITDLNITDQTNTDGARTDINFHMPMVKMTKVEFLAPNIKIPGVDVGISLQEVDKNVNICDAHVEGDIVKHSTANFQIQDMKDQIRRGNVEGDNSEMSISAKTFKMSLVTKNSSALRPEQAIQISKKQIPKFSALIQEGEDPETEISSLKTETEIPFDKIVVHEEGTMDKVAYPAIEDKDEGLEEETQQSGLKIKMPTFSTSALSKSDRDFTKANITMPSLNNLESKYEEDSKCHDVLAEKLKTGSNIQYVEPGTDSQESMFKLPTFHFPSFGQFARKGEGQVDINAMHEEIKPNITSLKDEKEIQEENLKIEKPNTEVSSKPATEGDIHGAMGQIKKHKIKIQKVAISLANEKGTKPHIHDSHFDDVLLTEPEAVGKDGDINILRLRKEPLQVISSEDIEETSEKSKQFVAEDEHEPEAPGGEGQQRSFKMLKFKLPLFGQFSKKINQSRVIVKENEEEGSVILPKLNRKAKTSGQEKSIPNMDFDSEISAEQDASLSGIDALPVKHVSLCGAEETQDYITLAYNKDTAIPKEEKEEEEDLNQHFVHLSANIAHNAEETQIPDTEVPITFPHFRMPRMSVLIPKLKASDTCVSLDEMETCSLSRMEEEVGTTVQGPDLDIKAMEDEGTIISTWNIQSPTLETEFLNEKSQTSTSQKSKVIKHDMVSFPLSDDTTMLNSVGIKKLNAEGGSVKTESECKTNDILIDMHQRSFKLPKFKLPSFGTFSRKGKVQVVVEGNEEELKVPEPHDNEHAKLSIEDIVTDDLKLACRKEYLNGEKENIIQDESTVEEIVKEADILDNMGETIEFSVEETLIMKSDRDISLPGNDSTLSKSEASVQKAEFTSEDISVSMIKDIETRTPERPTELKVPADDTSAEMDLQSMELKVSHSKQEIPFQQYQITKKSISIHEGDQPDKGYIALKPKTIILTSKEVTDIESTTASHEEQLVDSTSKKSIELTKLSGLETDIAAIIMPEDRKDEIEKVKDETSKPSVEIKISKEDIQKFDLEQQKKNIIHGEVRDISGEIETEERSGSFQLPKFKIPLFGLVTSQVVHDADIPETSKEEQKEMSHSSEDDVDNKGQDEKTPSPDKELAMKTHADIEIKASKGKKKRTKVKQSSFEKSTSRVKTPEVLTRLPEAQGDIPLKKTEVDLKVKDVKNDVEGEAEYVVLDGKTVEDIVKDSDISKSIKERIEHSLEETSVVKKELDTCLPVTDGSIAKSEPPVEEHTRQTEDVSANIIKDVKTPTQMSVGMKVPADDTSPEIVLQSTDVTVSHTKQETTLPLYQTPEVPIRLLESESPDKRSSEHHLKTTISITKEKADTESDRAPPEETLVDAASKTTIAQTQILGLESGIADINIPEISKAETETLRDETSMPSLEMSISKEDINIFDSKCTETMMQGEVRAIAGDIETEEHKKSFQLPKLKVPSFRLISSQEVDDTDILETSKNEQQKVLSFTSEYSVDSILQDDQQASEDNEFVIQTAADIELKAEKGKKRRTKSSRSTFEKTITPLESPEVTIGFPKAGDISLTKTEDDLKEIDMKADLHGKKKNIIKDKSIVEEICKEVDISDRMKETIEFSPKDTSIVKLEIHASLSDTDINISKYDTSVHKAELKSEDVSVPMIKYIETQTPEFQIDVKVPADDASAEMDLQSMEYNVSHSKQEITFQQYQISKASISIIEGDQPHKGYIELRPDPIISIPKKITIIESAKTSIEEPLVDATSKKSIEHTEISGLETYIAAIIMPEDRKDEMEKLKYEITMPSVEIEPAKQDNQRFDSEKKAKIIHKEVEDISGEIETKEPSGSLQLTKFKLPSFGLITSQVVHDADIPEASKEEKQEMSHSSEDDMDNKVQDSQTPSLDNELFKKTYANIEIIASKHRKKRTKVKNTSFEKTTSRVKSEEVLISLPEAHGDTGLTKRVGDLKEKKVMEDFHGEVQYVVLDAKAISDIFKEMYISKSMKENIEFSLEETSVLKTDLDSCLLVTDSSVAISQPSVADVTIESEDVHGKLLKDVKTPIQMQSTGMKVPSDDTSAEIVLQSTDMTVSHAEQDIAFSPFQRPEVAIAILETESPDIGSSEQQPNTTLSIPKEEAEEESDSVPLYETLITQSEILGSETDTAVINIPKMSTAEIKTARDETSVPSLEFTISKECITTLDSESTEIMMQREVRNASGEIEAEGPQGSFQLHTFKLPSFGLISSPTVDDTDILTASKKEQTIISFTSEDVNNKFQDEQQPSLDNEGLTHDVADIEINPTEGNQKKTKMSRSSIEKTISKLESSEAIIIFPKTEVDISLTKTEDVLNEKVVNAALQGDTENVRLDKSILEEMVKEVNSSDSMEEMIGISLQETSVVEIDIDACLPETGCSVSTSEASDHKSEIEFGDISVTMVKDIETPTSEEPIDVSIPADDTSDETVLQSMEFNVSHSKEDMTFPQYQIRNKGTLIHEADHSDMGQTVISIAKEINNIRSATISLEEPLVDATSATSREHTEISGLETDIGAVKNPEVSKAEVEKWKDEIILPSTEIRISDQDLQRFDSEKKEIMHRECSYITGEIGTQELSGSFQLPTFKLPSFALTVSQVVGAADVLEVGKEDQQDMSQSSDDDVDNKVQDDQTPSLDNELAIKTHADIELNAQKGKKKRTKMKRSSFESITSRVMCPEVLISLPKVQGDMPLTKVEGDLKEKEVKGAFQCEVEYVTLDGNIIKDSVKENEISNSMKENDEFSLEDTSLLKPKVDICLPDSDSSVIKSEPSVGKTIIESADVSVTIIKYMKALNPIQSFGMKVPANDTSDEIVLQNTELNGSHSKQEITFPHYQTPEKGTLSLETELSDIGFSEQKHKTAISIPKEEADTESDTVHLEETPFDAASRTTIKQSQIFSLETDIPAINIPEINVAEMETVSAEKSMHSLEIRISKEDINLFDSERTEIMMQREVRGVSGEIETEERKPSFKLPKFKLPIFGLIASNIVGDVDALKVREEEQKYISHSSEDNVDNKVQGDETPSPDNELGITTTADIEIKAPKGKKKRTKIKWTPFEKFMSRVKSPEVLIHMPETVEDTSFTKTEGDLNEKDVKAALRGEHEYAIPDEKIIEVIQESDSSETIKEMTGYSLEDTSPLKIDHGSCVTKPDLSVNKSKIESEDISAITIQDVKTMVPKELIDVEVPAEDMSANMLSQKGETKASPSDHGITFPQVQKLKIGISVLESELPSKQQHENIISVPKEAEDKESVTFLLEEPIVDATSNASIEHDEISGNKTDIPNINISEISKPEMERVWDEIKIPSLEITMSKEDIEQFDSEHTQIMLKKEVRGVSVEIKTEELEGSFQPPKLEQQIPFSETAFTINPVADKEEKSAKGKRKITKIKLPSIEETTSKVKRTEVTAISPKTEEESSLSETEVDLKEKDVKAALQGEIENDIQDESIEKEIVKEAEMSDSIEDNVGLPLEKTSSLKIDVDTCLQEMDSRVSHSDKSVHKAKAESADASATMRKDAETLTEEKSFDMKVAADDATSGDMVLHSMELKMSHSEQEITFPQFLDPMGAVSMFQTELPDSLSSEPPCETLNSFAIEELVIESVACLEESSSDLQSKTCIEEENDSGTVRISQIPYLRFGYSSPPSTIHSSTPVADICDHFASEHSHLSGCSLQPNYEARCKPWITTELKDNEALSYVSGVTKEYPEYGMFSTQTSSSSIMKEDTYVSLDTDIPIYGFSLLKVKINEPCTNLDFQQDSDITNKADEDQQSLFPEESLEISACTTDTSNQKCTDVSISDVGGTSDIIPSNMNISKLKMFAFELKSSSEHLPGNAALQPDEAFETPSSENSDAATVLDGGKGNQPDKKETSGNLKSPIKFKFQIPNIGFSSHVDDVKRESATKIHAASPEEQQPEEKSDIDSSKKPGWFRFPKIGFSSSSQKDKSIDKDKEKKS